MNPINPQRDALSSVNDRKLDLSQGARAQIRRSSHLNSNSGHIDATQTTHVAARALSNLSHQKSSENTHSIGPISEGSQEIQSLSGKIMNFLKNLSKGIADFVLSFIPNWLLEKTSESNLLRTNPEPKQNETIMTNALKHLGTVEPGSKEAISTFSFTSKDRDSFEQTLRNFSSQTRQFESILDERKFELTIEGKTYQTDDTENAREAFYRFFDEDNSQAIGKIKVEPLNIGKYYFVNGISNFIGDNKNASSEEYNKEVNWFTNNSLVLEAKEGKSKIEFLEKQPGNKAGLYKFQTSEIAELKKYNSNGSFETIGEFKIVKEFVIEKEPDGNCRIDGKKTISIT